MWFSQTSLFYLPVWKQDYNEREFEVCQVDANIMRERSKEWIELIKVRVEHNAEHHALSKLERVGSRNLEHILALWSCIAGRYGAWYCTIRKMNCKNFNEYRDIFWQINQLKTRMQKIQDTCFMNFMFLTNLSMPKLLEHYLAEKGRKRALKRVVVRNWIYSKDEINILGYYVLYLFRKLRQS